VKHWALPEADERNKNALPPDLWVFFLRQAAIEGGASVRFQSLVKMELAVTDAMWHVTLVLTSGSALSGLSPKSIKTRSFVTSRPS
jgi:hypothetical protein